jgi:DNA polymerase elongation subunit (family B)
MKHPSIRPLIQTAPDSSLQYTYTTTIGSRVYIRARDAEGNPHILDLKYEPTYYLPTTEYTGITTLDGAPLLPHRLDSIQDGRDFLEQHPEAYGNIQCEYMALADTYGDTEILPDLDRLYIWNLDIETASDEAFAPPEDPFNEITAITVRWRHRGDSGVVVYGTKPYSARDTITYYECADEAALLTQFVKDWRGKGDYPDIITGWNVQFFDMPYLVNRIRRVLSEEMVLKLSPFERIANRMVTMYGRDQSVVDIRGIAILDYLELYKKFTYTQQESYRLDHIAHVELGKRKLSYEEYKSLAGLYRENYPLFISYNINDVELVDELDQKLKLIELVVALAYNAKANYVDTFRQVRWWDIKIYHYLRSKNIQIPARREVEKTEQYAGAYVKEPLVGQHEWIVSYDLVSLYPHILRQWNLSPETMVSKVDGKWHTVDDLLTRPSVTDYTDDGEYALAANGVTARRDVEGFIPAMMREMYEERATTRKLMKDKKKELEEIRAELKRRA